MLERLHVHRSEFRIITRIRKPTSSRLGDCSTGPESALQRLRLVPRRQSLQILTKATPYDSCFHHAADLWQDREKHCKDFETLFSMTERKIISIGSLGDPRSNILTKIPKLGVPRARQEPGFRHCHLRDDVSASPKYAINSFLSHTSHQQAYGVPRTLYETHLRHIEARNQSAPPETAATAIPATTSVPRCKWAKTLVEIMVVILNSDDLIPVLQWKSEVAAYTIVPQDVGSDGTATVVYYTQDTVVLTTFLVTTTISSGDAPYTSMSTDKKSAAITEVFGVNATLKSLGPSLSLPASTSSSPGSPGPTSSPNTSPNSSPPNAPSAGGLSSAAKIAIGVAIPLTGLPPQKTDGGRLPELASTITVLEEPKEHPPSYHGLHMEPGGAAIAETQDR
ncbi:hypothetical protein BDZ45DRAFT_754918 [Acephala macrosclerotiorum]|nr:hypothetical protein BDZ45DRAFT_754918 [Acephala macrosclerotiorum]